MIEAASVYLFAIPTALRKQAFMPLLGRVGDSYDNAEDDASFLPVAINISIF